MCREKIAFFILLRSVSLTCELYNITSLDYTIYEKKRFNVVENELLGSS